MCQAKVSWGNGSLKVNWTKLGKASLPQIHICCPFFSASPATMYSAKGKGEDDRCRSISFQYLGKWSLISLKTKRLKNSSYPETKYCQKEYTWSNQYAVLLASDPLLCYPHRNGERSTFWAMCAANFQRSGCIFWTVAFFFRKKLNSYEETFIN